jgi:hypothetical protein
MLLQYQQHILHNITFRNCTKAATGVTVNPFIMLTHSDEFVPEVRATRTSCCVDAHAVIAALPARETRCEGVAEATRQHGTPYLSASFATSQALAAFIRACAVTS